MQFDPTVWNVVQDGGFAALCVFLIYWTLKSTGDREKSFRDREKEFLTLMTCYADQIQGFNTQLQHVAELLKLQTERIENLNRRSEEMNNVLRNWMDRRMAQERRENE